MCGIIGYAGHRPAVPVVIEGLRRLEYRGYDSAGVACVQRGGLGIRLRGEDVALAGEGFAQLLIVLDDAVMHDGQAAVVGSMGMGIALGGHRRARRAERAY